MIENSQYGGDSQLNNEFKIWKKNAPYLYDTVITHLLEWPSLTVQWLPNVDMPEDSDYTRHRLLLGTQTVGNEPNYIMIAKVKLPKHEELIDTSEFSM